MKVIQVEYPKEQKDEERIRQLLEHYNQSQKAELFDNPREENLTHEVSRLNVHYKVRFMFGL